MPERDADDERAPDVPAEQAPSPPTTPAESDGDPALAPGPRSPALRRAWNRLPAGLRRRWLWAPGTVITAVAVLALVGSFAAKSPCLHTNVNSTGQWQNPWPNYIMYRDACYSDVIPLYGAEQLNQPGAFPYQVSWIDGAGTAHPQKRYMEYPVLTGLLMWVGAQIAQDYVALQGTFGGLPLNDTVVIFFEVLAVFASVFWLIAIWCIRQMSRRRPWDALIAAASPLVVVQAFENFDMMAVAFATAGMLAWSRRRTVLAGVLIGLGTAAKLYPILLLIPLLALSVRAGKLRAWLKAAGGALAAWTIVNAPIAILFPRGWTEFLRLNNTRGADPDSLYNVVAQFTHWGGFDGPLAPDQAPTKLNAVIAALLIACTIAIVLVALSAPRRPRVAQLGFLIVSAFLITNKVWSPQYSLWLIPLAVLAMPRWKLLFPWMLVDAWLWFPRMRFYLPSTSGGWSQDPFLWTVVARDAIVAALCAVIVYEIYHPDRDLVRRSGDDDPAGGVLEDTPDAFRVRWRRHRGAVALPEPWRPEPEPEPVPGVLSS